MNIFDLHFLAVSLMGAFVGAAAAYVGSLMFTKRMALVGGAFGHLALPGIALGLVYNFDVSIGALLFIVLGMFLVWWLEKQSHLPMEALSAVVFTTSLSVAWIFLPEDRRAPALIGDISNVSWQAILISILASILVFVIVKLIYKQIFLSSISEDLAKAYGIDLKKYNFVYLAAIAIATALGVRIIGGLMTVALIAIPAATSRNMNQRLSPYIYTAMLLGAISSGLGIWLYPILGIPPGLLIVIISALMFVLSLFFKKQK